MKIPINRIHDDNITKINNIQFLNLFNYPVTTIYMQKPEFRKKIIPSILSSIPDSELTIYLDFDTWLRSYFSISSKKMSLMLFSPNKNNLEDSLISLLSWTNPNFNFLIIDSIPSFSLLVNNGMNSNLSHGLLSYYLSSLKNLVQNVNAKMILVSFPTQKSLSQLNTSTKYIAMEILNYFSDTIIYSNDLDKNHKIKVYNKKFPLGKSFILTT